MNYTHKQLVAQQGNLACWLPFQITYATHFNHDRAYGNALFFYYRLYFNSFFFETLANAKLIIVTNQEAIEQIHTSPHGAQLLFVETPAAQAYESLSTIMNDLHALRVQHPEAIPILSCGPAGKIIVYRLACEGIISYDVGFGLRYLYDQNDHATGLPTITAANRS